MPSSKGMLMVRAVDGDEYPAETVSGGYGLTASGTKDMA